MKVCLFEVLASTCEPTGREIEMDSPTVRIAMQVHLCAVKKEHPNARLSLRGKSIYTENTPRKGYMWSFSIIEK